ncbi:MULTISPECIES: branched-chain amino acid ABC transporter permease [unclassified Bosea (in: a-proteobacteria)]|uniref:branched-chain amino acid ABC transporter permease n=1 Tax=unclassified Bosea (in: a-proteobacteria) TaxID=2653178 RepID=UPI000F764A34|nr:MULTISPECIES: branched-chain amino acid ABC transporter permease [unclassified Bosea (in: a-proteobacteria)]AZO81919.1 branched-chain amino acid ABC transporter permease [Bosea sp. Tri-49]RXT16838.1 branched-chain amino acid ABC transporter permease [Bosea sp. Tri-39]RXT37742.1 branched-chain amino acid ABC transporter permease [Bosea sp. Tri-54]
MSALNPISHGGLSKPALSFNPITPLIFAALIASYFLFPNHLALATQILVLMIFALSYDLLQGHAGIVSLGHAVFLGLGAYGSAILARWGFTDPLFGLMAGASISALVALVLSPIVVRGSDFTRLLVTLGVASLIHEAANRMRDLTGGADGLADFEVAPLLGLFAFDFEGRTAFLYALIVFAFVYAALWRVTTSPFGLALRGIRENPRRMPAIGSPVARHLAVSYLLSGAIAGVGGALLAQTSRFASLDMLGFERSAEIVMVVTLGGTGHIAGVSIGAAAFGLVKDALSTVSPRYWQLGLGIVLMASVFLARGGIGGLIERFCRFGRRA